MKHVFSLLLFTFVSFANAAEITASITNTNEEGIAEATIESFYYVSNTQNNATSRTTVKTDANGNYSFKDIPSGKYVFLITAKGYHSSNKTIFIENETLTFNTQMLALGTIKGSVTDISGNGLPNVSVEVFSSSDYNHIVTNENGEYLIKDLRDDEYRLKVRNRNNYRQYEYYDNTPLIQDATPISTRDKVVPIDIILGDIGTGSISGFITNSLNQRIVNAKVDVNYREGADYKVFVASTTTNNNGMYTLNRLQENDYYLSITATNYRTLISHEKIVLKAGDELSKNIQLTKSESISGIVQDLAGKPLNNIRIVVFQEVDYLTSGWAPYSFYNDTHTILTDEKGHYFLPDLKAGQYRLLFLNGNYFEFYGETSMLEEANNITTTLEKETDAGITTIGNLETGSISGIVSDITTNKAIENITVRLTNDIISTETKTNSEGRYTFNNLTANNNYFLKVSYKDEIPYLLLREESNANLSNLQPDSVITDANIQLKYKYGNITGTVKNTTGQPLKNKAVHLFFHQPDAYEGPCLGEEFNNSPVYTDSNGSFTFWGAPIGNRKLSLTMPTQCGYEPTPDEINVTVKPHETTTVVLNTSGISVPVTETKTGGGFLSSYFLFILLIIKLFPIILRASIKILSTNNPLVTSNQT